MRESVDAIHLVWLLRRDNLHWHGGKFLVEVAGVQIAPVKVKVQTGIVRRRHWRSVKTHRSADQIWDRVGVERLAVSVQRRREAVRITTFEVRLESLKIHRSGEGVEVVLREQLEILRLVLHGRVCKGERRILWVPQRRLIR